MRRKKMKQLLYFAIIIALIPFAFVSCGNDEDGSASIRGKVTDEAGNQIPGANISIRLTEEQATNSESNGEFHFTNLIDGNYQLTVSANGYRTHLDIITIQPGKLNRVDIMLKKGDIASIAGLVHDIQTGDAITNATVPTTPVTDRPVTNSSGRYEFVNLESGTYTVRVFAIGYSAPTATVVVERNKTARADFQVTEQVVQLSVTPSSLDFGVNTTSSEPLTKTLTIENLGSDTLTWNISFPAEGWLTVAPADGNATDIPSSVSVTVDRRGFPAGNYDLIMLVTSNGGTKEIPVKMEVQ